MSDWSQIHRSIWGDLEFQSLSVHARLLFIYGFTHSREASITGLSVVSPRHIRMLLGLPDVDAVRDVLAELGDKPFLRYDFDAEVLWVVNRLGYVVRDSQRWVQAARRVVERMPQGSPIISEFRRYYEGVLG